MVGSEAEASPTSLDSSLLQKKILSHCSRDNKPSRQQGSQEVISSHGKGGRRLEKTVTKPQSFFILPQTLQLNEARGLSS